jgi:RNA polymerase sigma-70 factor (ECF subfamily)
MAEEDKTLRTLMIAAQEGNRRLYAELLAHIIPSIRRAAHRRWPHASSTDLEDVVQETLLALHVSRHLYDPDRPVMPFILGIMRFRGSSIMRGHRRASVETHIDEVLETAMAIIAVGDQESAYQAYQLRAAVGRLRPGQRRAIEMMKLSELSLDDAAAATGMSVAALKVATHRGILALRKLLKRSEPDED